MTARPIPRTHPLTGAPLEPLGIVGGRIVWPILGGSAGPVEAPPAPTGDALQAALAAAQAAGTPATTPPVQPTPTQPPAQPATPTAPAPAPSAAPKAVELAEGDDAGKLLARYTPEELAAYALTLRKENGRSRSTAKATAAADAKAELAQQIGKALGLVTDDAATVTPEQLTADLRAARDQARTAAVQLELYRTAHEHGATAGDLLSLVVLRDTSDLDPGAADFRAKVIAAAQAAVTANPILKAAPAGPATARSGAEFTGGTGHTSQPTNLEEAVRLKMGA